MRIDRNKEEKEAKEKIAAQSTPAAGNSNASKSPSSSSPSFHRSPHPVLNANTNGVPANAKKAVDNKLSPPTVASPPGVVEQVHRPHPPHLPPFNAMSPQQMSPHLPPPPHSGGTMYGLLQMIPSTLSPNVGSFPPMGQYPFGAPNVQQHHPPGTPLPAGCGFNGGPPLFDPPFNRGMPIGIGVPIGGGGVPPDAPSLIGLPKQKTPLAPASTSAASLSIHAAAQGRRGSALVLNTSTEVAGPGPIMRPIAPIARPPVGASGGGVSSGYRSPNRRSPSPKGVLGSSALAADDDEVVAGTGPRRVVPRNLGAYGIEMPLGVPAGQTWSPASPRMVIMAPWGLSGFSPSPRGAPNPIGWIRFTAQGDPPHTGVPR